MKVAIVTDSTAYLSADQLAAAAVPIRVIPLHVVIGGREHREGVDISAPEIAEALRRFVPVTTSRPAPLEFLEAYQRAAELGADSVVSVHISADMSATVQGAQLAASQSPVPVHVVDSRVLGGAMGYAVLSGAQAASRGAGPEEVATLVRERAAAARVVFYVHTLEHLRRGGRIGSASALVGSALAIKPILALEKGHIEPIAKVRTTGKALSRLVELAAEAADEARDRGRGVDVIVQHLAMQERADELAQTLTERIPDAREVRVGELGAVIGAHVGPGAVAVIVAPGVEPGRSA